VTAAAAALPPGYVTFRARHGTAVVQESEAQALAAVLEQSTLYAWAATTASATRYQGRLPAYGVALPGGRARVVVRHATHGGFLAPVTSDRFLAPGRAPRELRIARSLLDAGVATPVVVGYALYDAGPLFCRSDVMTSEITGASDLPTALGGAKRDSRALLEATARLLVALARAGAHHADLNLKNVLIASADESPVAYVLDVDRVRLGVEPGEAMQRNLARLQRSARKWRGVHKLELSELDLHWLTGRANELAT
jgi:hypothetical protein